MVGLFLYHTRDFLIAVVFVRVIRKAVLSSRKFYYCKQMKPGCRYEQLRVNITALTSNNDVILAVLLLLLLIPNAVQTKNTRYIGNWSKIFDQPRAEEQANCRP